MVIGALSYIPTTSIRPSPLRSTVAATSSEASTAKLTRSNETGPAAPWDPGPKSVFGRIVESFLTAPGRVVKYVAEESTI